MKQYQVNYTADAEKALNNLDSAVKTRIKNWIQKNLVGCENPRARGIPMEGELKKYWRYRVGDYRLIADIQDDKILILIVDVDKRNDIYKKKNVRKLK